MTLSWIEYGACRKKSWALQWYCAAWFAPLIITYDTIGMKREGGFLILNLVERLFSNNQKSYDSFSHLTWKSHGRSGTTESIFFCAISVYKWDRWSLIWLHFSSLLPNNGSCMDGVEVKAVATPLSISYYYRLKLHRTTLCAIHKSFFVSVQCMFWKSFEPGFIPNIVKLFFFYKSMVELTSTL